MITFLLSMIFSYYQPISYASNSYYARVMYDQVYLYKTASQDNSYQNVYFEIPRTYFVQIFNETGSFYEASYMGISGFVLKNSVQAVSGTPSRPELNNISFRVYADLSRDLRIEPNTNNGISAQVKYLPLYTTNVEFIGEIHGEARIKGRTDVWYYCKYTDDIDYFGYVYSDFCDEKTEIVPNTETLTYINNPTFTDNNINSIPQNNNAVAIIVLVLTIPALIFLFYSLKGKQIFANKRTNNKEITDY